MLVARNNERIVPQVPDKSGNNRGEGGPFRENTDLQVAAPTELFAQVKSAAVGFPRSAFGATGSPCELWSFATKRD
jgi:hypothetical protein